MEVDPHALNLIDAAFADPAVTDRARAWLAGPDRGVLGLDDPVYPPQLRAIPDPPPLLFWQGRLELLARSRMLAVVGTRTPSAYGFGMAEHFAGLLADAGVVVVSGLALGIDARAQARVVLAGGDTIAVLGCGIDVFYPKRHTDLQAQIARSGLVLSEFPVDARPLAHHFPRRNRIISGLTRGTLVVEAKIRSGSLVTARLAAEQGREVFAVPGPALSALSSGCHLLIEQGAKLTTDIEDITRELAWDDMPADRVRNEADDPVFAALGALPTPIARLAAQCDLPVQELAPRLMALVLEGRALETPGGYSRAG